MWSSRVMGIALLVAVLAACATIVPNTQPVANQSANPLFSTIAALDAAAFASFNNCSSSEELQKHASYFAPDVEFYHDTGGVTWSRHDMLANTEKYVCGKFRRELVPGSLVVFPIKDYGAIEQGIHRFCPIGGSSCEGIANFILIWRHQADRWQVTRVLSYGHRQNEAAGAQPGAAADGPGLASRDSVRR